MSRAGWAALLVVPSLAAGCTGAAPRSGPAGREPAPATARAWWTPHAGYCELLRQTVRAGGSVLSGVATDDPARLATTEAFVAALERAAPPAVAAPWRVLGPAVTRIVASRGQLSRVRGVDAAAVRRAATAVAAHARASCHVELGRAAS